MSGTLWYVTDYCDETMPCAPTLEGWAEWLSKPDLDWSRPEPAAHGDTFQATTMERHDDVVAEWTGEAWTITPEPPPGADFFAVTTGGGGWDADMSGETPLDALGDEEARQYHGDGPVDLACCTQIETDFLLRFEITPAGSRLYSLGPVQ
jgi:hypothetical protein